MLKKQFYVEPQAEVLEVQGEAVICLSYNGSSFENGHARNAEDDDYYWN